MKVKMIVVANCANALSHVVEIFGGVPTTVAMLPKVNNEDAAKILADSMDTNASLFESSISSSS